ncbi:MAG: Tex family protein [Gemmataceae bacterium]
MDLISQSVGVNRNQAKGAIDLLDAGNTIPFIARYRKEVTGKLDEQALRAIEDALTMYRDLAQRKTTILKTIDQQGKLTEELHSRIVGCMDKKELEDLYLPFKPKRSTRATAARERGLEPLAKILLSEQRLDKPKEQILQQFVSDEKKVPDAAAALQGACDIIAEQWCEDVDARNWLLQQAKRAYIVSQVKRGKKEEGSKFEMYFDYREPIRNVPSHRLLAMKRGEAEGILKLSVELDDEVIVGALQRRFVRNPNFDFYAELLRTVEDCYSRLLKPATDSSVLHELKDDSDDEAVAVFAKNLRELLLAPPGGPQVTIGIDPGFRTGCKVAVVDGTGKFLTNTTIYPTPPKSDLEGAGKILQQLITKYDAKLIAIGNGTASRETDAFVTQLIKGQGLEVTKVVVNESGASIYSASEIAAQEYPNLDVTVRGAISIAHRLQDPLAELVKIDPKSIGVGQYQHDVNQTLLKKSLDREVESCVNSVGVDVNLASAPLLSYVAGIGPKLAQRIVEYRDAAGRFTNRSQLTKVPKLGKKAFEQAAGFLRIRDGEQPLDNSAVHPESYYVVQKMASRLGVSTKELVGNESLAGKLRPDEFVDDKVGLPTVQDILSELAKPGRDPRSEFQVAEFAEGINELEDLTEGMTLNGAVTNVTKFGAFVDIGVHQDGLIHISELDNQFVEDPSDVVSVGDVVKVVVLNVDLERRRIGLSRKQALGG